MMEQENLVLPEVGNLINQMDANRIQESIDIVIDYGSMFDESSNGFKTRQFIYDTNLLPHPKDRIISACFCVIVNQETPDLIGKGAMLLGPELSHFQDGVGPTPISTFHSVLMEGVNDDGYLFAKNIANYKKSAIEIKADKERKTIMSLLTVKATHTQAQIEKYSAECQEKEKQSMMYKLGSWFGSGR